eukprot:2185971-Karenia_brevis.AAC.1
MEEDTLEPWPEFIKRATRVAEQAVAKLKLDSWTLSYWRRKLAWASKLARQEASRWTIRVTKWRPEFDRRFIATRSQARPFLRWDDEIQAALRTVTANPNSH